MVSGCFVHVGTEDCSVWLSALVFVEMQLFHLLLQEGNRHGAASGSLWQCVDLENKRQIYHHENCSQIQQYLKNL